jgi:hypothetical protein
MFLWKVVGVRLMPYIYRDSYQLEVFMKRNKQWFEGLKWAESIFKDMFFHEALKYVEDKLSSVVHWSAFDRGASDYCRHVQKNIEIFRYRFKE